MEKSEIEAILRQQSSFLSGVQANLERDHKLEQVACPKCATIATLVRKKCADRLCPHCVWRYQPLCRMFQSLEIVPTNLLTLVLPYPTVPLAQFSQQHVTGLHQALAKVLRQAWIKQAVKGGHYFLEFEVNRKLKVRLHIHLLVQTYQPVHARPIDIYAASRAWCKLTGLTVQNPQPLREYTFSEANKAFAYTVKQTRGERAVPILKALADYSETDGKYCERALQLRAFIIRQYNRAFAGRRKRSFFGSWRSIKPVTQGKAPGKREYRCPCERAPLTPLLQ